MATELPATIELCQRIRDGLPCLGRVHRSGVPEIACCTACGKRDAGAIYVRQGSERAEAIAAAVDAMDAMFSRWLKAISKNPGQPKTNDVVFYSTVATADLRELLTPGEQE